MPRLADGGLGHESQSPSPLGDLLPMLRVWRVLLSCDALDLTITRDHARESRTPLNHAEEVNPEAI